MGIILFAIFYTGSYLLLILFADVFIKTADENDTPFSSLFVR